MKGTTVADRLSYLENEQKKAEHRPPFAPVQPLEQNREPFQEVLEPQRSLNFFSPAGSEYDQYDVDDPDQFELMNITIIVYGLSGIMCEKELPKKKRSKFGNKNTSSWKMVDSIGKGITGRDYSGSTLSSTDISATDEAAFMENQSAPTTAVASFRKNAFGSQHSLETFLPSIPLHIPNASSGGKFRYAASWPSVQSTLTKDEAGIERSSFNLTRCMRQEKFVPRAGVSSNYVHETLELRINLSRGTELIRLGTASLVISGEEEGELQMHIPAKPILHKSKKLNRKRFKDKAKSKSNKYGYFSSDLTRRYHLDENATIRVGIRVIPQDILKIAEEREKKENNLKHMLKTGHMRPPMMDGRFDAKFDANPFKHFPLSNMEPFVTRTTRRPQTPPQSMFPNFFCGAMLCAPESHAPESNAPEIPLEIMHTTNEFSQFGVASLISSVSESADESDYSEGEMEAQINNFRMAGAFQLH